MVKAGTAAVAVGAGIAGLVGVAWWLKLWAGAAIALAVTNVTADPSGTFTIDFTGSLTANGSGVSGADVYVYPMSGSPSSPTQVGSTYATVTTDSDGNFSGSLTGVTLDIGSSYFLQVNTAGDQGTAFGTAPPSGCSWEVGGTYYQCALANSSAFSVQAEPVDLSISETSATLG
jgi:hypothetical protein